MKVDLERLVGSAKKVPLPRLKHVISSLQKVAHGRAISEAKGHTRKVLEARLKEIEEPAKIYDFAKYIGNFGTPQYAGQVVRKTGKDEEIFDRNRAIIEKAIYGFYAELPANQRSNVHTRDIIRDISEVREVVGNNTYSLSHYLRTIRKKGWLRYNGDSARTYTILASPDYESVERTANQLIKNQRYVTIYDLESSGIGGRRKVLSRLLSEYGKRKKLNSEDASLGHGRHCLAYFRGKRPAITPFEKVKAVVGNRKTITLSELKDATSLSSHGIGALMGAGYLDYRTRVTTKGTEYYKQQ